MFRREFDHLPQENFALVFGNSFRMNPPAIKRPIIGLGLFLSLFVSMAGFFAWSYDVKLIASPMDTWMYRSALVCLAAQVFFFLVSKIRILANKYPTFPVYVQLLENGGFRYMLCFTGAMYAEADGVDSRGLVSAMCLCLFVLSEIGCNVFMFSRIASRMKAGKYRPDGKAFWDSKKQSNIVYGVVAAPVCLGLSALLNLISGICDVFDFAEPDFSGIISVLLALFFVIVTITASLAGAYMNVRQNVLIYCLRRFGYDTDGYGLDRDEPQDEEPDESEESEESEE